MDNIEKIKFLEDWLISEKEFDSDMMFHQGLTMGIDLYAPRVSVMMELSPDPAENDEAFDNKRRSFLQIIRFASRSLRDSLYLSVENKVILLMAPKQDESPRAIVKDLVKKCRESTGLLIFAGIEMKERKGMDMRRGICNARRAMLANRIMDDSEGAPYSYSKLFWYSFIPDIPDNAKREMIRQCFPEHSDEEIREALPVLYLFYDCEKDYRATAEQLHIHPNTLRYRMDRLQKKSGVDPRGPEGTSRYLMTFYLWAYFYPEDYKKWKETYGIRLNKDLYMIVTE